MHTPLRSPRALTFGYLFLVPILALGCRCSEDGQDKGPPTIGGEDASSEKLPRDYSRETYDFWPLPAVATVGHWVERRVTAEREARPWTERFAIVGQEGDAWRIEESEDRTAPGRRLVRSYLVRAGGKIVEGRIGYEGEPGEPLTLIEDPAPFADEPEESIPGPTAIEVPAGRFDCSVDVYGHGEDARKVYRSPRVPYDGVVKSEETGRRVELLASGTDAKPLLVARPPQK